MAQDVLQLLRGHQAQADTALQAWIRLSLTRGLAVQSFSKLCISIQGELERLLTASVQELLSWGMTQAQCDAFLSVDQQQIDRVLDWQSKKGNHLVVLSDPEYPRLLAEIYDPPIMLFVRGNPKTLSQPQIAVVGSRTPTISGMDSCKQLSEGLAQSNWVVTSGMAVGIDGAAHSGALNAGGVTIGVLGCGVDVCYPKRHKRLSERLLSQGGCLVSELPPDAPPLAQHFPKRNRIVSGMAVGTLVVEAKCKSGSLITARMALEQGRDVFAVPGSIHNPMSEGCHFLIKQGAKLVSELNDINEEYQHFNLTAGFEPQKNLEKSEQHHLASVKLLDSVDSVVTALDVVVERSNLPISSVTALLLELELRGFVTSVPGGYVKLGGK